VTLEEALAGRPARVLAETGSTNDDARAWARDGAPHGAIVLAEEQTRGRGRLGRAWMSRPGEGLYFSIVLRPKLPPAAAPPLTLAVGLALLSTARASGAEAYLKWPNDLLAVESGVRKKCAGVLTEMATSGAHIEHVIVGIGLNVNVEAFTDELAPIATSLRRCVGHALDRGAVLRRLLSALDERYAAFVERGTAATVRAWKAEVDFLGKAVNVSHGDERVHGIAEDVNDEGALVLRKPDGTTLALWAGDVS